MKKALAVLLSVLVAFSMFTVMTFAAGSTAEPTPITIKFVVDDTIVREIAVKNGEILTPFAPENPSKPSTDTTKYTFEGWQAQDENGNVLDETLYQKSTLPSPYLAADEETKTIVYKAVFTEKNIEGNQTFFSFLASIFERFNLLFQYFAEVFGF
ncbi:MAG: hypothetical protein IJW86_07630 [Clostridia bacterium]|nr:hypothetical protein [Clostridia bacterium]